MPTYLDGLHSTLHALAWTAGAATVILPFVLGLLALAYTTRDLTITAHHYATIRRTRRQARRSGRTTGP